jgi:hypothetical protein
LRTLLILYDFDAFHSDGLTNLVELLQDFEPLVIDEMTRYQTDEQTARRRVLAYISTRILEIRADVRRPEMVNMTYYHQQSSSSDSSD